MHKDNKINQLIDPNNLYLEMNQILDELAMRFQAKTQEEMHGESIDTEELEFKMKILSDVAKDPDTAILSLPFKLDAITRATASLMARNNDRLLHIVYDLILRKNGQSLETDS